MKTLVYSTRAFDKLYLEKANANNHDIKYTPTSLKLDNVYLAEGCTAVSLFSNDDASATVLDQLHKYGIQYLALRSAGYDHVDINHATTLGIKVANVPEYSPYAIAEHGVAMLMMLNRKLYRSQILMQMQDFRLERLIGFDIHGKTVGIIGAGKIGFAFANIMYGMGCHLLAYDPTPNLDAKRISMQYTSLNDLLHRSDIISLNCPLNTETKHLIDYPQFELMKDGVYIINTARGAIINTSALIQNLRSGKIGGACLDVYEYEKGLYFNDHRNLVVEDDTYHILRSFQNVLMTAHQAFFTKEALSAIAKTTIHNLSQWEESGTSPNEI